VRWLLKNWYRVKGGRSHLADFSRKGINGFFVKYLAEFCKQTLGKLNKNYDTTTNYIV
jgi:hypothetical protein